MEMRKGIWGRHRRQLCKGTGQGKLGTAGDRILQPGRTLQASTRACAAV